ncbi:hypothetical protein JB92DRAFT_3290784 [Gautieria morchelliformis]|nr:hypothetical protein JB92DRAFT_3290784 [Gautieria morchelliformis]
MVCRHLQATNSDHNETTRTTKNEAALSSSSPSPSSPESPAIGVTSSLLPIINVSHGGRSDPRPGAGIITPSFPAPASRRAVGYMESVAQACSGAVLGWDRCGDGRAEVTDADQGGEVVMERWDKGRWGRGFKNLAQAEWTRFGCGDSAREGAEVDRGNLLRAGTGNMGGAVGAWASSAEAWAQRMRENGMRQGRRGGACRNVCWRGRERRHPSRRRAGWSVGFGNSTDHILRPSRMILSWT